MIQRERYLEFISCPVCQSDKFDVLYHISHDRSHVFDILKLEKSNPKVNIVTCQNCGHHYMTPVVRQELMNRYYSILNSEFYHTRKKVYNQNRKEYEHYTKLIQNFKTSGSVLEVGCGNGYLLKTLEAKGFDCYGVEPSPLAFDYAKNQLGLRVENKFLADSSFYQVKFDVVILIDVVEHIVDMKLFIQEIKKVLKQDGFIVIGTGNIDSLNARIAKEYWGYFLSWEHVSFFNRQSMNYLLRQNNFTDIEIRETSLQHKPVQNAIEFGKNLLKKIVNLFVRKKYYHGITYDHFIVTATNSSTKTP